jgi:iron complex outermembrane receptor protein
MRAISFRVLASTGLAALALPDAAIAQSSAVSLPEISVVSTTPLAGGRSNRARSTGGGTTQRSAGSLRSEDSSDGVGAKAGVDRDKIPAMVETISAEDIARVHSQNLTDTLMQRVPGVATSDIQGNGFVQDLRFRGFAASPLQGTPQGIAVYMNGIRINEAFGDTVNWDLIPTNAVSRADVFTNNPLFGLNALGGAVNIQMKNGFTWQGLEAEMTGGSFGRATGAVQYGGRQGNASVYAAAQGVNDDGWRYQSPSRIARLYTDLGWQTDRSELHLIATGASNSFGVVGPTPTQLIDQDYRSIYTWPQTTRNDMGLIALNGNFDVARNWSVQSNVYVRKFNQAHVDGNDADVEACSGASSSFAGRLCLDDDGFPAPPGGKTTAFRNQFAILDANGKPVPFASAATPYGTIDRTRVDTLTTGGSLQATSDAPVFGHGNYFVAGGSVDRSRIDFSADSTLGTINPDLSVTANPAIPGSGAVIHTLGNIGYGPVGLDAHNAYYGLYATDTFDVTPRLAATLGARLNIATIGMADQLGTSPGLNGDSTFRRLNPVTGLAYKLTPGLTAYAGYSESNRVPTPLELGCADPNKPCLLEGFLVSDPPLQQVVSKTYEVGLREGGAFAGGKLEWKLGLFRTASTNDIINVASPIQGRGVFQNVAATRRQGVEAGANFRSARWLVYGNYSYTDATYQFTGLLASPNNPMADANGNILVTPGKRIPGIPQHQFKAGADYALTPAWTVGADLTAVGTQYFVGDDANQNDKLPAYWFVNLHSSYQISKNVQVFALVNNVFNKTFATYGTYFDPQSVVNAIPVVLTDHRTITPAQPLAVYGGIRIKW